MSSIITRKLTLEDRDGNRAIIDQADIATIPAPVIILGDPGLGKSVLTKALGTLPNLRYIRAGSFARSDDPASLIENGERPVIDGLDEIASSVPGGGIDSVLTKLSAMKHPSFVLSCREADWRGAADRIKIHDDYGEEPVLLHLQPFRYRDAQEFLSQEFPELDAADLLDRLATRGLKGIYGNPLTLRLLGEVVQIDADLPATRAELLDRACHVILSEENPRHADAPHIQTSAEDLLLAAGALCGTLLLCDSVGVYAGPPTQSPDAYVNTSDIMPLPFADAAQYALGTRLFEAEGERRFRCVHRVVAEYLGAKWLAACFDQGCSRNRILGLLRHGEGVPTSLRGLHAWVAHFSSALASECIASDPYAVLRYGDAEKLRPSQARDLLHALRDLSEQDPYFRSEDWGRHPASGLMRPELKEELLSIIRAPGEHPHLSMLLIEAMIGAPVTEELEESLLDIVFNPGRAFAERSDAAKALHEAQIHIAWDEAISRLVQLADPDSARLAYNILARLDAREVPVALCVDAVLSHLGLTEATVSQDSDLVGYINRNLFEDLDASRLGDLLDQLIDSAKPFLEKADPWARSALANLVRRRAPEVLQANPTVPAPRVWGWISPFDANDGHDEVATEKLGRCIRDNSRLHQSLLEHVLLTPCATNTWMAGYALHDVGLGLYPTPEDLCYVLRVLGTRAADAPIDSDTWRQVLRLVRSADGLPEIVRTTALEIAGSDSELIDIVHEMSTVTVPEWQVSQQEHAASRRARRDDFVQAHRESHLKRAADVAAGDIALLAEPAAVYLGRSPYFRDPGPSHSRVLQFLGDQPGSRALDGFIAVLERTDLPTAPDIAKMRSQGKMYAVEPLLICGISELLRRQRPLSQIDEHALAAAYMAWQRSGESNEVNDIDIGEAIESVLFHSDESIERHFRASIEPSLATGRGHVIESYRFTRERRWRGLAAELAVQWLQTYPSMPAHARRDLTMCALAGSPRPSTYALLLPEPDLHEADKEDLLLRLLPFFVLDFDNYRAKLEEIVRTHPDFLWLIRDLVEWPSADPLSRLSIRQRAFIVEALGTHWTDMQRPTGTTVGDSNHWDASEFVRGVIFSIAGDPTPEATETLQALSDGPAATYQDTTLRALAQQRRVRVDFQYIPPTATHLQSVMNDGLPESVDDMRAYLLDRLDTLQAQIHASNTDMWEAYWANDQPRNENFSRNRLIDQISGALPDSIRFVPEELMPGQTRADIAAIRDAIVLPVEIKGQWHKDVWNAATDQLDAKYARDWHAQGRAVYIVLWFGDVPGKQLPTHPDGLVRPDTPESLRLMLEERLPEEKRSLIDIYVMDVANPG